MLTNHSKTWWRFQVFQLSFEHAWFLIVEKDFCLKVILLDSRTLYKIFQATYMKFPWSILTSMFLKKIVRTLPVCFEILYLCLIHCSSSSPKMMAFLCCRLDSAHFLLPNTWQSQNLKSDLLNLQISYSWVTRLFSPFFTPSPTLLSLGRNLWRKRLMPGVNQQ